ncbi:MAG TPA: pyridoxal-phosphate dependent enzyme [Terriglobales bacterium]|nr:pyridoxal-phosphate dependent enzyme [Terriglobales bacterium]
MNTRPTCRISTQAIEQARHRIAQEFLDSRQIEDMQLSRAVGARFLCKVETENPVGSFKGRGAESFIQALPDHIRSIVTASAGNFGLAMAYAARRRGIMATVYAAENASPVKLQRIRAAGGRVIQSGKDFDEAKAHARRAAENERTPFVEDGLEPEITAGAGTMAMEITASGQRIDTMLVPLGNGALLGGIACWFKSRSPATRIIGVSAAGAPAMALSWRSHTVQSTASVNTIADGIAVRVPVPEALADLETVVDDVVLVTDHALKLALKLFHEHLGLIVEPSAVAGIAALLSDSSLARGVVCTPITGGNISPDQLRAWLAELP